MKGCLVDFICFTYFYSFTRFHTLNSSWQLSRNLGHAASSECGSANLLHRRPLPWQLCHAGPCSCICFNAKKNASDGFLEATFSIPSAQMRTRTASHRMGEDHPIWTMQGLQYFPRILGTSSMLHDFSAKKSVIHPYFLLKDHSQKKKNDGSCQLLGKIKWSHLRESGDWSGTCQLHHFPSQLSLLQNRHWKLPRAAKGDQ